MNPYHMAGELPTVASRWLSKLLKRREEMLLVGVADARATDCWWPQR